MELIGKQIAIETILGQPPELHYPSWYAAQIEKLPPAPPEYLAEQAGILVTDSDTISRQAAISAICSACGKIDCDKMDKCEKLRLPPANNSEIPNSSDTISRQAAIEAINKALDRQTLLNRFVRKVAIDAIEQLPPAQPEIVRCKDCKHGVLDDGFPHQYFCIFKGDEWNNADYFCGHAKRREVTT